jgi:hypothetical protein
MGVILPYCYSSLFLVISLIYPLSILDSCASNIPIRDVRTVRFLRTNEPKSDMKVKVTPPPFLHLHHCRTALSAEWSS